MEYRIADTDDIAGVINLQMQYLYVNLSEEERAKGFVTTPFNEDQLRAIIEKRGLFIADDNGRIAGYAMAADWGYFLQWPIFCHMTGLFPDLKFGNIRITVKNSFQYGPVCIHELYRGSGVFQELFNKMRHEMSAQYPVGLTFINKINTVSFNAHTRKTGSTVIGEFRFNNNEYHILAFDTRKDQR
jgi:hypothetical protein